MACDICGKATTNLNALTEQYATDEFKMCCSKCESELNKYIWQIRKLSNSFLRNMLIERMKSEKERAGVFK